MKIKVLLLSLFASPSLLMAQTCPNQKAAQMHASTPNFVSTSGEATSNASPNIADTAIAAGKFQMLVTALKAGDLVDVLKGKGPFTVFAPNDEAFAKLPKELVADLLKPENKKKLQSILTYHVVPGLVTAEQVVKLRGAVSVQGQQIDISTGNGSVMVDGAKVLATDIKASNGIIHVIDSVILPADKNLAETLSASENLSTLLAAVSAAGLAETFKSEGPFTLFAPSNEAFAKLPPGTVENLLKPENKSQLVRILTYHAVSGKVLSSQAAQLKAAVTLNGKALAITASQDGLNVDKAKVVDADLEATNGVVHVIDSVLLP
jgi:transforming growth factor-beta-induced protein